MGKTILTIRSRVRRVEPRTEDWRSSNTEKLVDGDKLAKDTEQRWLEK